MIVLYYHPACWTSYRLIKRIGRREGIRLVDVSREIGLPLSRGVVSVPLIEVDERQLYGGPVDIEKAAELIEGKPVRIEASDPEQLLISAVTDSGAASAIVYVTGDVKQLLPLKSFLSSCTGVELMNEGLYILAEIKRIISGDEGLYAKLETGMMKTLAYNIARESKYLSITLNEVDDFIRWLSAKPSIGRVGAPFDDMVTTKAKAIYDYYIRYSAEIETRLNREIELIKGDKNFRDILASYS